MDFAQKNAPLFPNWMAYKDPYATDVVTGFRVRFCVILYS